MAVLVAAYTAASTVLDNLAELDDILTMEDPGGMVNPIP